MLLIDIRQNQYAKGKKECYKQMCQKWDFSQCNESIQWETERVKKYYTVATHKMTYNSQEAVQLHIVIQQHFKVDFKVSITFLPDDPVYTIRKTNIDPQRKEKSW